MIIEGLDKGFIEGDGPYYPQMRTEIRPRPLRGFRDRFYASASRRNRCSRWRGSARG